MPEHRDHDVRSRSEDEGIPDLQQETPGVPEAGDADETPLPAERPVAVLDVGTTAEEQLQGESLDSRLSREEPDVEPVDPDAVRDVDDELDSGGAAGPGGTDIPGDPAEALLLEQSTRGAIGFDTDGSPEPAGRLVDLDEGARTDTESDLVADDVGADAGGFTAEEDAVRIQQER